MLTQRFLDDTELKITESELLEAKEEADMIETSYAIWSQKASYDQASKNFNRVAV